MAVPAWFDYQTYFNNKLAQLQGLEPTANWTAESLTDAFTTAQYSVTADGMYKHFVDHGNAENVSPSPYFVYDEYMANKLAQLQRDEPNAGWTTVEQVEDAFEAAGLSAWDHYLLHGMAEGINPSASFDTNAYMDAKLEQLLATEPTVGWTMEMLLNAFQKAGLNPIEHYVLHGQYENLSYAPDGVLKPATDTLTVERDVLTLGAGDQIVEGVVSALSAENTLNANDNIDGGEGNDTLRVTLNSNFTGFKVTDDPETTGGVKNVENVELINNGQTTRSFSATGIDGATTYSLSGKGGITVKDLAAAGVTVNVNGMQKDVTVNFTADAVKGTSDSMTFGLSSVGAAATADTAASYVKLTTSAGLESLNIKATGSNYVDLSGVDVDALTVTGSGALDVNAVAANLSSVDASAAKGDVTVDLSSATSVNSITGGAGNDTFTVKGLAPNAVLDGGAGEDTLIISGTSGAMQPTLSGFETIGFTATSGDVTLSAKNAQDFTSLLLDGAGSHNVLVSGLTGSAFSVNLMGQQNSVTLADAVDLTVNVMADADATKSETVNSTIQAAKATNAVINVGANAIASGSYTFAAAQSVQLNVASSKDADGAEQTGFNGMIKAANAESLEIKADGLLGSGGVATFSVAKASSVVLDAAQGGAPAIIADAATDVQLTAGADLNLILSRFSGAQTVTIEQKDGALSSLLSLTALSSLTISGEGANSAVSLGDLGDAKNDYDLMVQVSGLAKGFVAFGVAASGDVTLDFSQMTGEAMLTGDVQGSSVTIMTSDTGKTTLGAVTATSGDITIDASGKMGDFEAGALSASGDINLIFDGSADVTLQDHLSAGNSITLDASGYLNSVSGVAGSGMSVGTIKADTVTLFGSELASNFFAVDSKAPSIDNSITANTLNYTGGIAEDTITLNASTGTTISATLNTGLGKDTVKVDMSGASKATTLTLSGDLGGDTDSATGEIEDTLTISGAASTLKTIDLSGLDGYTATFNVSGDFVNLTTLKLGGGQDIIDLDTATSSNVKIEGFTAGQGGDKIDLSALSLSGSGTFTFVTEATGTASNFTFSGLEDGTADIAYYDAANNKLYFFDDVIVTSGSATTTSATATINLVGLEGELTEDNFIFTASTPGA